MRTWTAIIGLVLFGQLSCSNEELDIKSFNDDSSITTLNGTWKVLSFESYTDNIREFKNQENSSGLDIIINFDDTKDPNELSGTNTTNTVFGEFEYIGTRKFKINNYGTTEVAQPVWADISRPLNSPLAAPTAVAASAAKTGSIRMTSSR